MINNTLTALKGVCVGHATHLDKHVTDMALMPELNKTYPSYFSEPYPAREAICVKALPLGMDIEISVIATKADNE
jgi:2-iminobutanoate/2-iminopropanoate deaminase